MPNPSSILGSGVVSWVDVSTATMYQDAAGTIPAAVGDPVGYISDGTGAAPYTRMGSENRPILRQYADGTLYLESTSAAVAGLQSVRSVSFGEFFTGARIRRPSPDASGGPILGAQTSSYPSAYWLGGALEIAYAEISGYPYFSANFNNAAFLPNEEYRDLGALAYYLPMAAPSCVQLGINSAAETRINIDGRYLETAAKTAPVVSQTFSSLWFLAASDGGSLRDIGHTEISRFYILNAEPTPTEEAELLEWLTWGEAGSPYTGSNPSTIMGDAALSWFDVAQDTAATDITAMTSAGLGDPVRAIADGTGRGQYTLTPTDTNIPAMGDGHVAFTGQALNQFMKRTGQVWIGMRRAHTATFPANTVQSHFAMSGDVSTWWMSDNLRLADNGYGSDFATFFENNGSGFGFLGNLDSGADVGVFFNDMFGFGAGGVPRMSRDGVDRTDLIINAGAPGQTTRITSVGGILDNRTVNATESSDVNITRFYILTEEPTPEQEAALLAWLENGDPGPAPAGITYTGPQVFEAEGSATLSMTVDTGAAEAGRIVLIAVTGDGQRTVSSATFGGIPATVLSSVAGVGDNGTSAHVVAAVVPDGAGNQSCSITFNDSLISAVSGAWIIRGAEWPVYDAGAGQDDTFAFQANASVDIPANGAAFGTMFAATADALTITLGGVQMNTVREANFYGSGTPALVDLNGLTEATGALFTQNTNFVLSAAVAVFAPAASEPPLTEINGELSTQETGSDSAGLSGQVPVSGGISARETGQDTAALEGTVRISGSVGAREAGKDGAVLSGEVPVSGSLSAREQGADTAELSGETRIAGALSVRETGLDSGNFSGTVAISGELSTRESGADQASLIGGVSDPILGGFLNAREEGADQAVLSGEVSVSGSLAAREAGSDQASLTGEAPIEGALSTREIGKDQMSLAGEGARPEISGQLAVREEGSDQAALTGTVAVTGSMAAQESGTDITVMIGSVIVFVTLSAVESGSDDMRLRGRVFDGDLGVGRLARPGASLSGGSVQNKNNGGRVAQASNGGRVTR